MADKALIKVLEKFSGNSITPIISANSVSLNNLFGGGFPFGKYIQIYSPPGIGKTTVAVWIAIALARHKKKTLFIDVESALEEDLIIGCGGKEVLEKGFIKIIRPYTFKQLEEVFDVVIPSAEFNFIVVDSITATIPSKLTTASVEDALPGLKARIETNFLVKYKAMCRLHETSVLWINQMRASFGNQFQGGGSGASGSNALKFYCDVIISMTKAAWIMEAGEKIGTTVMAEAKKNKKVRPFLKYPLHIVFGKGISDLRTFRSLMFDNDMITQSGAYYKPNFIPEEEQQNIQGNEKLLDWIREHRETVETALKERNLI